MRNFFILTFFLLLISVTGLFFLVKNIAPLGTDILRNLTLFFALAWSSIGSIFTFVFFFMAELFAKKKLYPYHFKIALRRGFFFGLFMVILLILQFFNLLNILEVVLIAILLSMMEYMLTFFFNTKPVHHFRNE